MKRNDNNAPGDAIGFSRENQLCINNGGYMKMSKNRAGSKSTATKKNMRKKILCPKCGSRFMDSSLSTVSEIRILSENSDPEADYYAKCKVCNTELSLKKLG